MREAGSSLLVARKRGRTTIRVPGIRVADDLVERQFRPAASDVRAELDEMIAPLVAELAPRMLERVGFGVQLLVTAGDNPDRLSSEAAFAMLCGSAPLAASSGQTQRHRLNRGGDGAANGTLNMAAICRLRLDPRTKAYAAHRKADGPSKREIIRCLKRHIAREAYHLLTQPSP
jgi:transposase